MRGKSYRAQVGRYCVSCGRRCRKGGKGKFCTERCERKHYTKKVRENYVSRRWIRTRLLEKSNICGICKQPVNPRKASIDHIIPLVKGGKDVIENMQLAHILCNEIKGDELPPNVIIDMNGDRIYG